MAIMLNEESIQQSLGEIKNHAEDGEFEQATTILSVLGFDRLRRPIEVSGPANIRFDDPARQFGEERVHEVGDYLDKFAACVQSEDYDGARVKIAAALTRWNAGK